MDPMRALVRTRYRRIAYWVAVWIAAFALGIPLVMFVGSILLQAILGR
jgi:hypothetical protein